MKKKEKIIGTVKSKTSGITYEVKWKLIELSVWINRGEDWQMIGENKKNEEIALKFAQGYINSHPNSL
jgi:hypothetical protein